MKIILNSVKRWSATYQLFKKLYLWLIISAAPILLHAQEMNQNSVSNGAGIVSGGNYTGFASVGQMATYMFANGTQIATQGIILNEISGAVEFTFELSGTLAESDALKSGELRVKSGAAVTAGPPLAFVNVYLIDEETQLVLFETQTDANGFFVFKSIPYKNYYFAINEPIVPAEPILLSFESNIFIKEVEINGEVGTEGISTSVTVTPNNTCDPENPDYKTWYLDYDNDGFGTDNFSVGQCTQPNGYVLNNLDCDDNDAGINPGAIEIAGSGMDNNCDGNFTCNDPEIVEFISPVAPINSNENFLISAIVDLSTLESATWFWGDGSSSVGTLIGNEITGDHFYLEPGLFDITLVLEDACGTIVEEVFSYIVIVNPCEGNLEGEGKLSSIEDSFDLKSKSKSKKGKGSSFEFEVEYEKDHGEFELEGEFSFKSKENDFYFKAKKFEWLVVNNDLAYFKGTGQIDKHGQYNFLVAVVDGKKTGKHAPDFFRLIIWDDSGTVLFDNQFGDEHYAMPLAEIASGSIKIKKGCDDDRHDHKKKNKTNKKHVGINDSSGLSIQNDIVDIRAFPNPTTGKVFLEIDNTQSMEFSVSVINMIGQKIIEESYLPQNRIELDLSGNTPGVYFIKLFDGETQITKKIILKNK